MAFGAIYRLLEQQASLLAYADNFRAIGYLSLASLPLVLLMARPRHQDGVVKEMSSKEIIVE
jgi:hypothetical protein